MVNSKQELREQIRKVHVHLSSLSGKAMLKSAGAMVDGARSMLS